MSIHPVLLTIASIIGFTYICSAFVMLHVMSARTGYQDETGFHFAHEVEDLVVPADEVRPAWLTGAVAERFSHHRVEIYT